MIQFFFQEAGLGERGESQAWNVEPKTFSTSSHGRVGGWVVVVNVETADVGEENGPAAIGSDSC